jgi:hypothetical protein
MGVRFQAGGVLSNSRRLLAGLALMACGIAFVALLQLCQPITQALEAAMFSFQPAPNAAAAVDLV